MPRQVQVKYVCDCGHYHSYGGGEPYEPQGWVTAIERKDFEGKDVIEVQTVESIHDNQATDEGRKFFAGTECLERWLFEALTPEPESAPPVPEVPAAPRNAYAEPGPVDNKGDEF